MAEENRCYNRILSELHTINCRKYLINMHGTAQSWPLNMTQAAKIRIVTVRFYNFPQYNLPARNKR